MTIEAAEDGVLHISLHDDSSGECSDRQARIDDIDTTSTMTGEGRLEDATTLVASSPVLTCDDGREPDLTDWGSYTLVLDPVTGRLFDNLGDSWHRGAPPLQVGEETTKRVGPGTYSFLGGDVTFQADAPWSDHAEAYIDERLFFLLGEDDAQILIIANPTPLPIDPCAADLLPASAAAVVDAVRSNPTLEVTVPVAERLGRDRRTSDGRCAGSRDASVQRRVPGRLEQPHMGHGGPRSDGTPVSLGSPRRVRTSPRDPDHRAGGGLRAGGTGGSARGALLRVPHGVGRNRSVGLGSREGFACHQPTHSLSNERSTKRDHRSTGRWRRCSAGTTCGRGTGGW